MQYKVFGCKVNKYYTDRWLNSDYLADKTGTFVASCVVTDSAKRKWIRFVKQELKNITGTGKIYISGCGAFKDGKAQGDFFDIYPDLSIFQERIEILDEAPIDKKIKESINEEWKIVQKTWAINLSKLKHAQQTQIYTKKFILIQWWCNSFCTFCLTVQKRGRHYYRAVEDIIDEIIDFENQGWKEVVLTWVNLSAWGLDSTNDIHSSRFAEFLEEVLEKTSIPRLRISSLWPEFINDDVLNVLKDERIYPHFHFSVQSGSNDVLKSMARHYDGKYMKELLLKTQNIKRDDDVSISIWADIIVGFPGETQENFMETYNLIKDCRITKLHAFPFSAHTMWESVPAGKFKDQVAEHTKKDRMQRLMKLWDDVREEFKNSQKWKILKVLVEKSSENTWSGWSENYIEIDETNFEIIAGNPQRNSIVVWKFK